MFSDLISSELRHISQQSDLIDVERTQEAAQHILKYWKKSVLLGDSKRFTTEIVPIFCGYPHKMKRSFWRTYQSPKHLRVLVRCVLGAFESSNRYVVPMLDEDCNLMCVYECAPCDFADIILKLDHEIDLWALMLQNFSAEVVMFFMCMFFAESVGDGLINIFCSVAQLPNNICVHCCEIETTSRFSIDITKFNE